MTMRMSAFGIFSMLLLVVTTMFALSNPTPIALRFLTWEVQTSLALAVIGGVVLGGFLVFTSSVAGQRHLRARLRDLQARLRDAESRLPDAGGGASAPGARLPAAGREPEERP
jgi:uncharacterized integral membrane protein